MNKKILIILVIIILAGIAGYELFDVHKLNTVENTPVPQTPTPSPTATSTIEYKNDQYGFIFTLLQDWKGYSIVTTTWTGNATGPQGDVATEHGPLISIRNPQWTTQNPYQDIPIMVFTLAQWNALQHDQFHIGAAPINPSELGRNTSYVFALPARYNFAFPTGWEEVQSILDNHPLELFRKFK